MVCVIFVYSDFGMTVNAPSYMFNVDFDNLSFAQTKFNIVMFCAEYRITVPSLSCLSFRHSVSKYKFRQSSDSISIFYM